MGSWHGGPSTWKDMQRREVKGSVLCTRKEVSFCTQKSGRTFDVAFFFLDSREKVVKSVEMPLPDLYVRLSISLNINIMKS